MKNEALSRDIKLFLDTYPNFSYKERKKKQYSIISGSLDVCDTKGNYWNSFKIEMYINRIEYPYTIPIVKEVDEKIRRDDNWHINKEGICCLDIEHDLEFQAKRGIEITSFYREKVYPFFANTTYKTRTGEYANGEYDHNFGGVIQFYQESMGLQKADLIVKILTGVLTNNIPGRNRPCLCGSGVKIKNCHLSEINFLKSVSKERLKKDLEEFQRILKEA